MVMKRVPGPVGTTETSGLTIGLPGTGTDDLANLPGGVQRIGPAGLFAAPASVVPNTRKKKKKAAASKKAKKYTMPTPADDVADNMTAMIRDINWPVFHESGGQTRLKDVEQRGVTNCALASILAALARTSGGERLLTKMITKHDHPTQTTYSGTGKFHTFDGKRTVPGKRYYDVDITGLGKVEVSGVFFTGDSGPPHINMIYMADPARAVIWPSIIEKAYAALIGGYDKFSQDPKIVWQHVTGRVPNFLSLQPNTQNFGSNSDVTSLAKSAKDVPTIAAMAGKDHGFSLVGVNGKGVDVYDPFTTKIEPKSMAELRAANTVFFYQKF